MLSFDLATELCKQWFGKYNIENIHRELLVLQANNELTIIDCYWGNDKDNHLNKNVYSENDTPKLNMFGFNTININFCSINTIQLQYCSTRTSIYPTIESTFLIEIHNKDWLNKWYSRAIERFALRLERHEEITRRANRVNDIIKELSSTHTISVNNDFDAFNIISNEYT